MPRAPLLITKYRQQSRPIEHKQVLHLQATQLAAAEQPAKQPVPVESKPSIRYYQQSSNSKRPDNGFGSKPVHYKTTRNTHALRKGYKHLVANAKFDHLPGERQNNTRSFGLYFTLEHSYKQLIDSLRKEFLTRVDRLDTYRPLLAPELPLLPSLPFKNQERCQFFLQEFCARLKPFDIDFIPNYHQPKGGSNPRGYYRLGYSATSRNNKHQDVSSEIVKVLWPGRTDTQTKRRDVLLQPEIGLEDRARMLREELLRRGVQTFRVKGIVLRSTKAADEEHGSYEMIEREFLFNGVEESIFEAASWSRKMLPHEKGEDRTLYSVSKPTRGSNGNVAGFED